MFLSVGVKDASMDLLGLVTPGRQPVKRWKPGRGSGEVEPKEREETDSQ